MHKKLLLPIFILLLIISGCSKDDDDPILALLGAGANSSVTLPDKSLAFSNGLTNGGVTTDATLDISGNIYQMLSSTKKVGGEAKVNGVSVHVNSDGDFLHQLTLAAGNNNILIEAKDALGKEAQVLRQIEYIDITTRNYNVVISSKDISAFPLVRFTIKVTGGAAPNALTADDFLLFNAGKLMSCTLDDTQKASGDYILSYTDITCGKRNINILVSDGNDVGTATDTYGNNRALLVGINDYYGSDNDLDSCVNDVNGGTTSLPGLEGILKKSSMWKDATIVTLTDSNATKTKIIAALNTASTGFNPEDAFIFYYSGHGLKDYLVTFTPFEPTTATSWLEDSDLKAELEKFAAAGNLANIFVILDSCYSGTFNDAAAYLINPQPDQARKPKTLPYASWPADLEDTDAAFDKSLKGSAPINTIVLTAADAEQTSLAGGSYEYSLYTEFLLQGIGGENHALITAKPQEFVPFAPANFDSDSWISAEETKLYAQPSVINFCRNYDLPAHSPQIFDNDTTVPARLISSW